MSARPPTEYEIARNIAKLLTGAEDREMRQKLFEEFYGVEPPKTDEGEKS